MKFNWCNKHNEILTEVSVSKDHTTVTVVNHAKDPFDNAFGYKPVEKITWDDVYDFLASRTYQPNYMALDSVLKEMGLSNYDPIAMCKYSEGRMVSDHNWIQFTED